MPASDVQEPDSEQGVTEDPGDLESAQTAVDNLEESKAATGREEELPKVPPYSAFSNKQKWVIVTLVTFAGFFSPISSNIYFPAVPEVASSMGESIERINLSITVFLVFQAVTPTIWGSLADVLGRRIIYLSTLAVFIGSCIGLARTYDYWLLMLLRCLQAAGGASVIAIAQGTIADIATPSERGQYFGITSMGPMSAAAIGPVIGAALAQSLGWHSIFVFLAISCAVAWIAILLFLPETLRTIVGDGSRVGSRRYRPLISVLRKSVPEQIEADASRPKPSLRNVDLTAPVRILFEKDIACLLTYGSLLYGCYYSLLASLSSQLQDTYGLTTLQTGLCFLPNGAGCMIATYITRKVFDRDFRITAEQVVANAKTFEEKQIPKRRQDIRDLTHFPIEKARLRSMPFYFFLFGASSFVYGWVVHYKVHLSVPLIMTFFNGIAIMLLFTSVGTLAVDCFPEKSSSSTASNNLARCLLGAAGTGCVKPMINSVGMGPAFSIMLGIQVLSAFFGILEYKCGMKWRQARARRIAAAKAQNK